MDGFMKEGAYQKYDSLTQFTLGMITTDTSDALTNFGQVEKLVMI